MRKNGPVTKFSSKKDVSRAKLVKTVCVGEGKQMVRKFCEKIFGFFFLIFIPKLSIQKFCPKRAVQKAAHFYLQFPIKQKRIEHIKKNICI